MDARRAQEPLTAKRRALFRELARRDAEFAAQIAEAREQADGNLLVELHRRAVEGVVEDVCGPKGEVVGQRRRMSDRLLTEKLRSRFPREFASRSVIEQDSKVTVKPLGLDQLLPESQDELLRILEREAGQEAKRPTAALPIEERLR